MYNGTFGRSVVDEVSILFFLSLSFKQAMFAGMF